MRTQNFFQIAVMTLALLMGSCTKEQDPFNEDTSPDNRLAVHSAIANVNSIKLGKTDKFAILAKNGIHNTGNSNVITGDVGNYPTTGKSIKLSCSEVSGTIFKVPGPGPYPCSVTNPLHLARAVGDMTIAYNNVLNIPHSPNCKNMFGGYIGSIKFTPAVYLWVDSLTIVNKVFLEGSPDDIFILQTHGDLTVMPNIEIELRSGAQAKNVYWLVKGKTTIGEGCRFKGTILSKGPVTFKNGASLNGRILSQSNVSLHANSVTVTKSETSVQTSVD